MNPAHWHLIMNHIPIIGSFFATLLLIFGLIRKSNSIITASYWFFIIVAIAAFMTDQTGGKAAGYLSDAGLASDTLIKPHAEAADKAGLAIYITAALALLTLLINKLKQSRVMPVIILLAALAGSALMSWTGLLGGEIMHKEIRPGFVAPPADSSKAG